jgi:hypothetical protein
MSYLRNNNFRKVIQETFKGYGKGVSMITLVKKGIKTNQAQPYFLLVLVIRGTASAIFKATYLSLTVKKPLKLKKAKSNLIY